MKYQSSFSRGAKKGDPGQTVPSGTSKTPLKKLFTKEQNIYAARNSTKKQLEPDSTTTTLTGIFYFICSLPRESIVIESFFIQWKRRIYFNLTNVR